LQAANSGAPHPGASTTAQPFHGARLIVVRLGYPGIERGADATDTPGHARPTTGIEQQQTGVLAFVERHVVHHVLGHDDALLLRGPSHDVTGE
jgi:hypothetical protein